MHATKNRFLAKSDRDRLGLQIPRSAVSDHGLKAEDGNRGPSDAFGRLVSLSFSFHFDPEPIHKNGYKNFGEFRRISANR